MGINVVWHLHPVDQDMRAEQKRQTPLVIWFTGLSASGKSTVARMIVRLLQPDGGRIDLDGIDLTLLPGFSNFLLDETQPRKFLRDLSRSKRLALLFRAMP